MRPEDLVVNQSMHPDTDEHRVPRRWGDLIGRGSGQGGGFRGRGGVGLQRQGSRLPLRSPGWGWVGLRRQGSLLWRGAGLGRRAGFGGGGFSGLFPPPPAGPRAFRGGKRRPSPSSSKPPRRRLGGGPP